MTVQDLFVTPIYLILLSILGYIVRPFVTDPETKNYFIPALQVRFIGAIMVGLIYQFYYSWGDTFSYFRDARIIWETFLESPFSGLRLIFSSQESLKDLYSVTGKLWYFDSVAEYNTVRFVAFFSLFSFHTYSATALLMAVFSFSGSWAFYSSLIRKYANKKKQLAVYTLFIPSVVFWGSGIFKDTLTYGALLWLFYGLFNIVELKRRSILQIIIVIVSFLIIYNIKKYILICFIGVFLFWLVYRNLKEIRNLLLRILVAPILIAFALMASFFGASQVGEDDSKYSLDNIAQTAMITAYDIRYWTGKDAGSGYSLGELDGTWQNLIQRAPAAINVSLFRPYLWEVKNPLMLLSALESVFIFGLVIVVVFQKGSLRKLIGDPTIVFMLMFALVFAFAVGVSTYNFGSLSRYKIPLIPFFLASLVILKKK